jgi:TolB-like protein/DNA-binding winged helix-turn-helix (wHTH) protein
MSTANQLRHNAKGLETRTCYEFGPFVLDTLQHALLKQGSPVPLTPKTYDTLLLLVQNNGRMLSKEELMRALWPDSFVEESNLTQQVSMIRKALGESASEPRYIVTVPGCGYRFVAPVEGTPSSSATVPQTPSPAPLAAQPRRSSLVPALLFIGAIAVPTILAIAAVFWYTRRSQRILSAEPRISSIAVLPLENLSNDPDQEYFVEGMTDEIITDLAKLPGIRVISRTSTAQYKGTRKTMPQIARELNVDAVVEGTVLRSGNRVRIRTQLIYAPADRHLWAQAYERDLRDVLALQAGLAEDIAAQIQLKLTSQQHANLSTPRPPNPAAHELYLKGRYFWNKRDPAGFTKAAEYFQNAITVDPDYAAAYAGLADTYALSRSVGLLPTAEALPKAKAAAEKALQLDANLAEAHASLGQIAPFLGWDWSGAKYHYERAIELNPNYATAHHWYAEGYLLPVGELNQALSEMRTAQQLDPLSAAITCDLGKELYFARRYDEALVQFGRALELDPNFNGAHNWISDTLLEQKKYPEAAVELEKTRPFREERVYLRQTAYLDARAGRRSEARAALAKSLRLSQGKPLSNGGLALVYAALGDKNQAFSWLEKSYAENSAFLTSLKYWTVFDSLRSDQRYADLLRKIRLPQESQSASR